tara:strand:- start:9786 stop:10175 length:390 start_codon:yes stop_codon:yes gene_type:complete
MKKSNLTFEEGFDGTQATEAAKQGKPMMAFDWNRAAEAIKYHFGDHKDLVAEAGLQGDWAYTGGVIFKEGKPTDENYTYLASNWAVPTLILSWDGKEQEEIKIFAENSDKYNSGSKWDDESLGILGITI